jgi:type I site-specific restriction-modification system R (restriction) subunit
MPLDSESSSVQRPFIRYAIEAGWTYLSPDQALNLRQGGVTSPVLDVVLLGQLAKLNPGILNAAGALDIVRRLVRVRPSIEGNLDAWEFLKGLKTVFVDTEKRERNVQLLDPVNVDANQFHVTDEFTFSNGTPPDIRLDIVFFINGVPVLPVETKKATAMDGIAQALDDLRYYHKKGPELLALGQLHALSISSGSTTVRRGTCRPTRCLIGATTWRRVTRGVFGVRRQSAAATALWLVQQRERLRRKPKRRRCRRSPKASTSRRSARASSRRAGCCGCLRISSCSRARMTN